MKMDKFPGPESSADKKIEKETVLEILRTKGPEDPETKVLVERWTAQQEDIATKENTGRAAITLNIERADLYLAVGDIEGALDCLEDARMQAYQENEKELYDQIMKRMDELEG